MPIILYIIIQILICFVIDVSGAVNSLFKPLIKWILRIPPQKDISIKPLDCSLCLGFWCNLIVWLCLSRVPLEMLVIIFLSAYSRQISGVIVTVGDFFDFILYKIQKMIT